MSNKLGSMLTPLLRVESNRAYSNLFEVKFVKNDSNKMSESLNSIIIESDTGNIPFLAKKITFEDSFGSEVEAIPAIQGFMIKGPQRIKGVAITFKETAQYRILNLFKTWLNSIYDFDDHTYHAKINPEVKIDIIANDGINTTTFHIMDAMLKSLSYPEYDWGQSNPIEIQTTFSCGRVSFGVGDSNEH